MTVESELAALCDEVRAASVLHRSDTFGSALRRNGHCYFADPFAEEVVSLIEQALLARRPYSVIRLGEGEGHLLSYGTPHTTTPDLDWWAACTLVTMQDQRFEPTPERITAIRAALERAIEEADVVGVLGFWREDPVEVIDIDSTIGVMIQNRRTFLGEVRGRQFALGLPDIVPRSTILASAWLYVAVLAGLDRLLSAAERVVCITNRTAAVEALKEHALALDIEHLPIGVVAGDDPAAGLDFLRRMEDALPRRAQGVLHLVGAGPWAEIYCRAIKQRGGVGVDLGSGFDLLAGLRTRWTHAAMQDRFPPWLKPPSDTL